MALRGQTALPSLLDPLVGQMACLQVISMGLLTMARRMVSILAKVRRPPTATLVLVGLVVCIRTVCE